jgi:hypothetical protein
MYGRVEAELRTLAGGGGTRGIGWGFPA